MALDLNEKCKSALISSLADELPNFTVKNGIFIDRSSLYPLFKADKILPQNGRLRENLEKYIGEDPFFQFVYEHLVKFVTHTREYIGDEQPSAIFTGEKDSPMWKKMAKDVVEQFEILPWTYTFTLALPNQLSALLNEDETELVLSGNARLVRMTKERKNEFPLSSGDKKIDGIIHHQGFLAFDPEYYDDRVYFQAQIKGYVGHYGYTETYNLANSLVKTFFGLCLAFNMLESQTNFSIYNTRESYFVHRQVKGKGWVIDNSIDLEATLSKSIMSLKVADIPGDNEAKKMIKAVFRLNLPYIRSVMSNMESSGERITTATQWFFESHSGESELLSYIQAIVVLEILLGDKAASDLMGLGELLRNRCAYLIGKDRNQREELLSSFRQIYEVRSAIVHRGKRTLRSNERSLFFKLLWMCGRVIQEEAELLSKTAQPAKV